MQVPTVGSLVAATLCVLFILQFKDTSAEASKRSTLYDPALTLAVLDDLQKMIGHSSDLQKRKMDFGYQTRFGAGSKIGNQLLALKSASDINSPGRKRRDIDGHNYAVDEPELTSAVIDELIQYLKPDSTAYQKRRVDMGYGNVYRLGQKLMALKTAADWNTPGRKKRELDQDVSEQ